MGQGQELIVPLDHNTSGNGRLLPSTRKTTALTLPFFEDFLGPGLFPDVGKWIGNQVYINNTMGVDVISRGVATFDALNEKSGPYDSANFNTYRNADSLTTQFIDLSSLSPADSIYLSFFYQPQGNGFMPEPQDSLMLYFRRQNGSWNKVWSMPGSALQPFRQAMVPVRETDYFHPEFQFRFNNKASINLNDDVWNLDYIRMNTGRTAGDTIIQDVTTTFEPPFLLNDYTAMPYNQFLANSAAELATQHQFTMRNNAPSPEVVNYNYSAREANTNTPLATGTPGSAPLSGFMSQSVTFPMYTPAFPNPGNDARVVFEQEYAFSTSLPQNILANDTIRKQQVFDNYLAYDDGTAEKSYFLNQFPTLPAKLAIEYHLNEPGNVYGVAIYFGRQVPLATYKFFSVQVYRDIAANGGTDQMIYQQDLLFPSYSDTMNKFWLYKFDSPVPLSAGTFYLGTQQAAASGSDSLYFGLDVNRVGGNHLYYNVLNVWEPSTVGGALMVRPIMSNNFTPSAIRDTRDLTPISVELFPNPVQDQLLISLPNADGPYRYQLTNIQGSVLLQGNAHQSADLNMTALPAGVYMLRLANEAGQSITRKIIKL